MDKKKDFFSHSKSLTAMVDFIKWTSTFGEGMIAQIETPLSGVRLSPGLSHLFALARDDIGWMLVIDEQEGAWIEHFPVSSILVGASDGLIIVTDGLTMLEETINCIGIDIFIPQIELRSTIAQETLMGFGVRRTKAGLIQRVNSIVPVMTIEKYADLANQVRAKSTTSLFAAQ